MYYTNLSTTDKAKLKGTKMMSGIARLAQILMPQGRQQQKLGGSFQI